METKTCEVSISCRYNNKDFQDYFDKIKEDIWRSLEISKEDLGIPMKHNSIKFIEALE